MKKIFLLIGCTIFFACSDKTTESVGKDIPQYNKESFQASHSATRFDAQKAAQETKLRLEEFGIKKLYFSGDLTEVESVYRKVSGSELTDLQKNELKIPLITIMHERFAAFESMDQEKRRFYANEMAAMVKGGVYSSKLFAKLYSSYFKNEISIEDKVLIKKALTNSINREIERLSKQNDMQYSDMTEHAKSKGIEPLTYEEFMKMKRRITKSNEEQSSELMRLKDKLI